MIGIGDFDGKARNTRKVRTREDQIIYKGKKYRQDKNTGYYICTTGERRRLHVVMYEEEVLGGGGKRVPEGYVVHHIDWDKTHNEIGNFALVTVQEHNLIHNPPSMGSVTDEEKELMRGLTERGLIRLTQLKF